MRFSIILAGLILALGASSASAQLDPWKDYDISDAVWSVTTVKVDANMGDDYLEGLKATWVASNEVAKELGQIESYCIFRSDLPQSGHFNLLLIVKFKNTADLAPNKADYEAFMEKWGEEREKQTREIVKDYPSMRDITGEYLMREITIK